MPKYRIVEYNKKGHIFYNVEKKGWLIWHCLTSGPEDTIDVFYTIKAAREAISKDSIGSHRRIYEILEVPKDA